MVIVINEMLTKILNIEENRTDKSIFLFEFCNNKNIIIIINNHIRGSNPFTAYQL